MAESITPLISKEKISTRIRELGAMINQDYANSPVMAVCILKGGVIFFADLVRELTMPVTCEFLGTSSYGSATESSGEVKLTLDITHPIEGKNILIFEDIIDTGLTLKYIKKLLMARNPASIKIATLLFKPESLQVSDIKPDYCGFEIGKEFVIGYGLDYDGLYRQLPYVGVFKK